MVDILYNSLFFTLRTEIIVKLVRLGILLARCKSLVIARIALWVGFTAVSNGFIETGRFMRIDIISSADFFR